MVLDLRSVVQFSPGLPPKLFLIKLSQGQLLGCERNEYNLLVRKLRKSSYKEGLIALELLPLCYDREIALELLPLC